MARLARRPAPPAMKLFDDPAEARIVWTVRESGLGATARVPGQPDTWEGWEDSAVPPERLGEYLRRLRALLDRHGYGCALYGHFGQGCVPPGPATRRRPPGRSPRRPAGGSPDPPSTRDPSRPRDAPRGARCAHTLGGRGGGCTTTTSLATRVTPRRERTRSSAACRWPS